MEGGNPGAKGKAIVAQSFKVPVKSIRKPRTILSEDDFAGGISKIIERDFFPDIPKLEAKAEYYEALEKNDLVKLREIQMKCKRPDTGTVDTGSTNTPLTFETPEGRRKTTPMSKKRPDTSGSQQPETVEDMIERLGEEDSATAPRLKLDAFLARNTSEDSASFEDILKEAEIKHRHKHQWLFDKEKETLAEHEVMLALPSIEEQAMIQDRPSHLNTWEYQNRNTVMYVPQGVELSAKELIEAQKHKPREIVHANTRFHHTPFSNIKHKEAMQKAATFKALINHGKIGHDGKEVQPECSPNVNGFGFVGTPSPAPGAAGESPMMTWGELDSTPARLDGGDDSLAGAPATPGPVFKIPEMPRRDRLALELSEKASKAHRAKKEAAIKQVTRRFASPSQASRLGLSSAERLSSMSPAAQRLASKRLGIRTSTDKALQASYTPSPSSSPRLTPRSSRTPSSSTPGSSRSRASAGSTPASERGGATPGSVSRNPTASPSLTDHLLHLPKRARKTAADFF